jgi:predicted Zn-dependent protease
VDLVSTSIGRTAGRSGRNSGCHCPAPVKQTRRGLLVTFFWYIRGVDNATLLNTGMTRDGLVLIENGEIAGPVQNFRWNMSPLVGYNNLTAVGRSVPMHMGESYDGGNTGLIPPVRMEDFYMTSVSPAV